MPVKQYDSTARAGRPTPQQRSIGRGLPGPYGGDVYRKARRPISVYRRMSPLVLRKAHTAQQSKRDKQTKTLKNVWTNPCKCCSICWRTSTWWVYVRRCLLVSIINIIIYLVRGMVCVDGMGREKHSIWYGTFAVWYHGTMSWMYYMAKFAWWYGMFQYIRSVRVEYVIQISSVTSLYIGHWKLFENISLADRQTDRQMCIYQNRDSVLQTENTCLVSY